MAGPWGSAWDPIRVPDRVWREQEAVLRARDVGGLFRLAKRYAGASQHRIAAATGVPQSRVNALMNNRGGPVASIEVLERVADGLNLPDHARVALGLAPRPDSPAPTETPDLVPGLARVGYTPEPLVPVVDDPDIGGAGSVVAAVDFLDRSTVPPSTRDRSTGFGYPEAASAVEAMEYTRRAEATEVGACTLEHLQLAIAEMAAAFAHTPPAELFPQALWYRRHVAGLLESSRHTLRERRELYRCAGWLSVILGWLSHDLGSARTGEAYCLDAWEHGWQAEYGEICAWAMDAAASIAMYSGRPEAARDASSRGMAQAPSGSAAAVRVSCQLARASARLGRRDDFQGTLRQTRLLLDGLPAQDSGLFGADAGRISSYAATSAIWLGHADEAIGHARDAIDFYRQAPAPERSPTREAIAHLDLGIALTTLGRLEAAVEAADPALSTRRLTGSVLARAADLDATLRVRFAEAVPTRQFHERYEALTVQGVGRELTGP